MGRLVSEVMHRGIIACSSATTVQEVARILTEQDISALVVTDNQILVGIISRTDVVNARLYEQYWTQWHSLTAAHIMTKDVLTVPADASLEHAGRLLMERHIHRLVVVEERDGRPIPIGVLSLTDIVRDLATGQF
jgi:predicted transcriptional regulator